MIKKELSEHKLEYFILTVGLLALAAAFFMVWPNKILQQYLSILISMFYFIWGLMTSLKKDDISYKVIIEYFIISFLAGSFLLLVTK